MPITDLLDRIPFSPADRAERPGDAGRSFSIELPDVERVGISLPPGIVPPRTDALPETPPDVEPAEDAPTAPAPGASRAGRSGRSAAVQPPLPSWAVVLIGGLALLCLALVASLALAAGRQAGPETAPPAAAAPDDGPVADAGPDAIPVSFPADPSPIPVDLITRLEAASEEPLDVELSRLLDAIQHGFGTQSVQLDPTLRSYVYRMASRFEWNPDTFRVAVTAPDPDLATARGALLEHLFEDASATGHLQVGTGIGPHALTLVSE